MLVVVSVAMAVLVPRLTPQLSASRIAAATSVFASMANAARCRAAESGRVLALVVSPRENLLRLMDPTSETPLLEKRLDAGVEVEGIEIMGKTQRNETVRLEFYPDGTATEARFTLRSAGDASVALALVGATASLREL